MRHFTLTLVLSSLFFFSLRAQWVEVGIPTDKPVKVIDGGGKYYLQLSGRNFYRAETPFEWEPCTPISLDYTVKSVFASFDTLLLLTRDTANATNKALRSLDAGTTWQAIADLPFHVDSLKGAFECNKRIFCSVGNNQIFITDDLGANWAVYLSPFSLNTTVLQRFKEHKNAIYYSDYDHSLFRSTDRGNTWAEIKVDTLGGTNIGPDLISCQNSLFAFEIIGIEGKWFESQDEGQTWVPRPNFGLFNKLFSANNRLFAVEDTDNSFYSEDNGNTWIPMPNIIDEVSERVISNRSGLSVDGGQTWIYDWKNQFVNEQRNLYAGNQTIFLRNGISYSYDNSSLEWHSRQGLPVFLYEVVKSNALIASTDPLKRLNYSLDDGFTWQSKQLGKDLNCIAAVSNTIFMAEQVGILGVNFYYTDDFGFTLHPFQPVPAAFRILKTAERLYVTDANNQLFSAEFSNPLVFTVEGTVNPQDHNRLFTAGKYIFEYSLNTRTLRRYYNGTWVSAGSFTQAPFDLGSVVATIGVEDDLYLLTLNQIIHSDDGGLHWSKITSQFIAPGQLLGLDMQQTQNNLYITTREVFTNHLKVYQKSIPNTLAQRKANGLVYLDDNQNGQHDSGEDGMQAVILKTNVSGYLSESDSTGHFNLSYNTANQDFISAVALSPYQSITTPNIVIDTTPGVIHKIGIAQQSNITDLSLDFTATSVFRPGFHSDLVITIKNIGTVSTSGAMLNITLPVLVNYESSVPLQPSSIQGGNISFQLPTLTVNEIVVIHVLVRLDPTLQIGTNLSLIADVIPTTTDANPLNNTSAIRERVVGSYDPNDKAVNAEFIHPDAIQSGDSIIYTIRFQNTGNYKATFVRILDTLSSSLQPETVRMISASHAYTWSIKNRNVLDIFFDEIKLPDSTSNEPESHGFVKFSIKPDSTLMLGDAVTNTAHIYFDYNTPIVTNTVQSEVKIIVSTHQPNLDNGSQFTLSPNPGSSNFKVLMEKAIDTPCMVQVLDASGRVLVRTNHQHLPKEFSLPEWPKNNGVYFVQVSTKDFTAIQKLVVSY